MNLTQFLDKNQSARKVFGERELSIIQKQLLGVALTQSEKNRLSRDIREKFSFIKEAARFAGDFRLKKGALIKNIVHEAKDSIIHDVDSKNIKRILLYGSAVENALTPTSDIDIAVDFFEMGVREGTLFRKRLLGTLNQRIDIQVYNLLPEKIRKEIDEKGRVLYEAERKDRRA